MKWGIILLFVAAVYFQTSANQTLRRAQSKGCLDKPCSEDTIAAQSLPKNFQPMYLVPGTSTFWPYNKGGKLIFRNQQRIELYCEKTFRYPEVDEKSLIATYNQNDKKFEINNSFYLINEIMCKNNPTISARQKSTCAQQGKLFTIGYELHDSRFIEIYDVCFDNKQKRSLYAKHVICPGIIHRQNVLTNVFSDLLSVDSYAFVDHYRGAVKYNLNGVRLSRGHLATRADFFYGVQQLATYVYPNVAPQWTNFNSGNWADLERVIKSTLQEMTLECYTGTGGIMSYSNPAKQISREALYLDEKNELTPVPEFFFRVVYEPKTKKAVVFIGHNDVFHEGTPNTVCTNILGELNEIILTNKVNEVREGYLYACEFREFQNNYQLLPDITYPARSILFNRVAN